MTTTLELKQLRCNYDDKTVLDGINLTVKDNEILALLGPSGCGKTTLLRAIAGLQADVQGEIWLQQRCLTAAGKQLPPEQRNVGIIFQDYALFPHLTVADNISFGLQGMTSACKRERVNEMLELVRLEGLGKRYIHQLSGGQQQRVAIARALAYRPKLLLLDEPFSNIDSQVRTEMMREIRQILQSQKVSAVFVTHAKEEAFAFADKLALMHQGQVVQQGQAEQLYRFPASRFVADFLGGGNYLDAVVSAVDEVETPLGSIKSLNPLSYPPAHQGKLLLRPQQLNLVADDDGSGIVTARNFSGTYCDYQVEVGPISLAVRSERLDLAQGAKVAVSALPHALILL
ncbi:ABC transporter ATP-binding protein [Ferrimonas lipolytica]|uniref:ABC transporter ATP-binding protein n=1 Tax=Ferrimonas lipolytica TaxID=2724191 RepID=A0A6H1UFK0_9GAMM|nr:ABC transporter ATP-binding protein [Ferrimonas lipolytica]QIZ77861.1 ABC transporter ATP-binding protein [Ferrimonas lipolytica]